MEQACDWGAGSDYGHESRGARFRPALSDAGAARHRYKLERVLRSLARPVLSVPILR
jgi:hypothetical protein